MLINKSLNFFIINLKGKKNKSLLYHVWPFLETLIFLISVTYIWEILFDISRKQFGGYLALFYILFEFYNNFFQKTSRAIQDHKGFIVNGLEKNIFFINNLIFLECKYEFLIRLLAALFFYLISNLSLIIFMKFVLIVLIMLPFSFLFLTCTFYFVSILGIFFPDTQKLISIVFRVIFFLSPILWKVSDINDPQINLLFSIFNPIYNFINVIYYFSFKNYVIFEPILFILLQTIFFLFLSSLFFKKFNTLYKSWL